jgi:curved DNA-binding protein CbpA
MNYYDILEIPNKSNFDIVKSSYRKLILQYHPDKWSTKSNLSKNDFNNKFDLINQAYKILSDPNKKNIYDTQGIDGLNKYIKNEKINEAVEEAKLRAIRQKEERQKRIEEKKKKKAEEEYKQRIKKQREAEEREKELQRKREREIEEEYKQRLIEEKKQKERERELKIRKQREAEERERELQRKREQEIEEEYKRKIEEHNKIQSIAEESNNKIINKELLFKNDINIIIAELKNFLETKNLHYLGINNVQDFIIDELMKTCDILIKNKNEILVDLFHKLLSINEYYHTSYLDELNNKNIKGRLKCIELRNELIKYNMSYQIIEKCTKFLELDNRLTKDDYLFIKIINLMYIEIMKYLIPEFHSYV